MPLRRDQASPPGERSSGRRPPRRHWAVALALGTLMACATERPFIWVQDLPSSADNGSVIEPRDTILVAVRNQAALSGEFVVGDHGEYSQPTLGTIHVGGKTTDAVVAELQSSLTGLLIKPEVTVSIVKIAAVRVNVVGEVKTPGSYSSPGVAGSWRRWRRRAG